MIPFLDSKERVKDVVKCLDSQLWHACAGGMVQMPAVNAKVFYFPQGHAEHSSGSVDFRACSRVSPYILCRVSAVKFMADPDTDEVYAKIRLMPFNGNEPNLDDGGIERINGSEGQDKLASFAKTLTQSDANNGGGFSVPRYCAETIFPRLDYSVDPPVQTILAKDVHGETWKFRHIYRGTPRRHLLTTGWSTFVNQKKLVAGDSIVFLRAENGDLCVGIRRAKRGIGGRPELGSFGWNGNSLMPCGGFSAFFREDENKMMRNGNGSTSNLGMGGNGKVGPESVIEAATLASSGHAFEVVYYPRASTPEFCVKASQVKAALHIRWSAGMRFKMAFETEDSSRISWFMGSISSVQVADPLHWPDSPWRLLQVMWDEPDLLQNVKRVSPWLVELVSNLPAIHLSPFSPPRKKLRLPQHPDFSADSQLHFPEFTGNLLGPGNPFGCLPDNSPAGMQGARHAHYGFSLADIHLNKLHSGPFLAGFLPFDHTAGAAPRASGSPLVQKHSIGVNVSCLPTMWNTVQTSKKSDGAKPPQLVLFGQPILTEEQISNSCSGNSSSEGNLEKMTSVSDCSGSALHRRSQQEPSPSEGFRLFKDKSEESKSNLETGHCKVFLKPDDDVCRTIDLSLVRSYEELCRKLTDMLSIENSETLGNVIYCNAAGAVKHIGDEPFSDFIKTAKRLTILFDSSFDNGGT